MRFIMDEKKPFFLIKMCDKFKVTKTRFYLTSSIMYQKWMPGTPMPPGLIDAIVKKYQQVAMGRTFGDSDTDGDYKASS